jgi:hypothetical protein
MDLMHRPIMQFIPDTAMHMFFHEMVQVMASRFGRFQLEFAIKDSIAEPSSVHVSRVESVGRKNPALAPVAEIASQDAPLVSREDSREQQLAQQSIKRQRGSSIASCAGLETATLPSQYTTVYVEAHLINDEILCILTPTSALSSVSALYSKGPHRILSRILYFCYTVSLRCIDITNNSRKVVLAQADSVAKLVLTNMYDIRVRYI